VASPADRLRSEARAGARLSRDGKFPSPNHPRRPSPNVLHDVGGATLPLLTSIEGERTIKAIFNQLSTGNQLQAVAMNWGTGEDIVGGGLEEGVYAFVFKKNRI
jgi:hypothetical protein